MPIELRHDEDTGIIHSKVTGVLDGPLVKEWTRCMDDAVLEHPDSRGHLGDVSEAEVTLTVANLYFISKDLKKIDQTRRSGRKRALVVNEKDREKFAFLDLAAANQGYAMKLFTDCDAAKDWLTEST